MNFEDCKKVMIQYINRQITSFELETWASEHCTNCKERVCHSDECPLSVDGKCNFGE